MIKKIKEFIKKLIKDLVDKLVASQIWKKVVKIAKFLKIWGTQIINVLVLLVAYIALPEDVPGMIVGLWLFILLVYYLFWKIFDFDGLLRNKDTT